MRSAEKKPSLLGFLTSIARRSVRAQARTRYPVPPTKICLSGLYQKLTYIVLFVILNVMSDHEEISPTQGDAIIKHFGPKLGALVASSDFASELVIEPFVEAAVADTSSVPPNILGELMEARAEADEGWRQYHELQEAARVAEGLTEGEYQSRGLARLAQALQELPDEETTVTEDEK